MIIRNKTELLGWLVYQRADERRIIFANGVFDLPHRGHFKFLAECKRQGAEGQPAALLVAINGDGATRRLKGPERPVITAKHRMEILSYHRDVDAVIVFHSVTPLQLIKLVQPDVICKGSDYVADQVVGAHLAQVKLIKLVPDISTTLLITRMRH